MPTSWSREDSYCRGPRIKFTQSHASQTSIVILQENKGISGESKKFYLDLLERKGNSKLPRQLNAKEIKNLREILGSSTVGDNQFSRQSIAAMSHTPAFDLASAQLIELNNMLVLEVKGAFVNNQSAPLNYTRAIMLVCNDNRVLKIFLQTPSQDEFISGTRIFSELISSINWTGSLSN